MSGQRFPRRARLLQAQDYQRVFAQPRRVGDSFFTVLVKPNDQQRARLGLAIAKRQVSGAVQRNRLKRLVRECFRTHQTALTGLDLVVMARSAAVSVDNTGLLRSLNRLLQKISRTA